MAMANTYTQLFIHIVFAVKGRENIIKQANQDELFKYIGGIVKEKKHDLLIVNGMADHIHILLSLNPTLSISELVKEIKRCSSMFINKNKWVLGKFEWQSGYGAFSYSKSQIDKIYKYIENQQAHHKKKSFKEEYIEILKRFNVNFENKYIFNDV